MKLLIIAPFAFLLTGCAAVGPLTSIGRTVTHPTSITISVTDPNAFNGPIYNTPPKGQHKPDGSHFGTIGGSIGLTWSLNPIKVERQETQPARIMRALPVATPNPSLYGSAKN